MLEWMIAFGAVWGAMTGFIVLSLVLQHLTKRRSIERTFPRARLLARRRNELRLQG